MNSPSVNEAVSTFKEGLSCSQAILLAYGKRYGIDEKTAIKVARSFGGGMARTCQTCGAVTGAYMVLGPVMMKTTRLLKKRIMLLSMNLRGGFKHYMAT